MLKGSERERLVISQRKNVAVREVTWGLNRWPRGEEPASASVSSNKATSLDRLKPSASSQKVTKVAEFRETAVCPAKRYTISACDCRAGMCGQCREGGGVDNTSCLSEAAGATCK
jgi:hypothetical protein